MIFQLRDYVLHPLAIKRFHDLLGESQYWSVDRRREWVQERLDRTLRHAVQNVPYYRKTLGPYESDFNDMVDRLDISALPELTKETVRENFRELHAENLDDYGPVPTETSGSTGTPTKFLLDRESNIIQFASIWRVLNWAGYRFGDRFADLTGFLIKGDRLFRYDLKLNCLHLSSFNFKKENMPLYVQRLKRFNPVLIKAYPSSLELFCRWLRELELEDYRPPSVLTAAETLLEHQEAIIREVLQCPVFDFYNQNERAALFSTCGEGTHHVHEEYSFVEIVDRSAEGFGSGGAGEVVATTFHNRAMPLIRYRTNDLAEADDSACSCGRTYRTVQNIIGRVEDVVITPDGRHVGRLDAAFKASPGVRLSQVVQDTVDTLEVKIVKGVSFQQSDLDKIEEGLRARVGSEIEIRFAFVDSIPAGTNGKIQFVISKPGREAAVGTVGGGR
jgi:phenylacetate-CoA ligase